jgi:iron complex outermembrane receptor protein
MAIGLGAHAQEAQPSLLKISTATVQADAAATATATDTAGAVSEVVITGSLIKGVQAVGAPVKTYSADDFKKQGAVTIGDVLKAEPAITMIAGSNVINGGGYVARAQNINVRNLSQKGTRTLLLVDGMRFPNQGNGGCQTDPSIIPQMAVEQIDVLTDGASATYGSDAVAGVVNVIMKRGFQGSKSQVQYGGSTDIGGIRRVFSQLYGHSWDQGNITASFEYYDQAHIEGTARDYFTQDFSSYGLDDRRSILNSRPGIVSTGAPRGPTVIPTGFSPALGTTCINCFSIPKGQNGVGLNWNTVLANQGVANRINVFDDGWEAPEQKRWAGTIVLDEDLTDKVKLFAEAFYSQRESHMIGQSSANSQTVSLPSTYGFYPIGGPAGLQVSYDLALEVPDKVFTQSQSYRYNVGLNISLPHEWSGKVYASSSYIREVDKTKGLVNRNNVNAAVGNTVAATPATAATPAIAAYTKPANLPYLNLFCDPTAYACNSADVLNYISGFRNNNMQQKLDEFGATASGPLFNLPGGALKGAVGVIVTNTTYKNAQVASNANTTQVVNNTLAVGDRQVYSGFAQLNAPLFSAEQGIPLIDHLTLEASVRYDHYDAFGATTNPKFAFDWGLAYGLSLKGTIGSSFRAPSFQENADGGPGAINVLAGAASNTIGTCATVGQPATPGSIAALIDPTCSASLQFLGGLSLLNAAQSAAAIRPGGVHLTPEKGENYSVTIDYRPQYSGTPLDFLNGLDVSTTYWFLRIQNKLQGYFGLASLGNGQLNDPTYAPAILTAANDPDFKAHVLALLNSPLSSIPVSFANSISFISDGAIRNIGWQTVSGTDVRANYRWRMFDLGVFNAGLDGTISMTNKSRGGPGQPIVSFYDTNHDGRFRYRTRLGWSDGPWSVNGAMNFIPHYGPGTNPLAAPCFQTGNALCSAFGPQFAQYTSQQTLTNHVDSVKTFDLAIDYDTGEQPSNSYLKNIDITLSVVNVFNKQPPFQYAISPPGGGAPHAFFTSTAGTELGIMGRTVNLSITKSW